MGSFGPPPVTALAPGEHLDRYELLCVLAQGGMGTVWLARMTGKHGFERLVALKTILAAFGNDRQFSDMFLDEARIAAQIDHENVARILEIGEDKGALYHAMELIDGESVRKLYRDIRAAGAPFPLAVALRICADVCAGLHAVHELKGPDGLPLEVVHRDVSPQNVLLTTRGTVKLIDFGVAKARQRRTEETTAGTLKGKLEYMAPEQAMGEKLDRRADVYAVGAMLYELLCGEPVRNAEDGRQLLALHELMTGAPYPPLRQSIPLPVRTLVDRSLARDPSQRFGTAEDMRRALEQAMLAIGHTASTDDVANVLGHFSRERTLRRKTAIDAAVRAAKGMSPESIPVTHRASLHTVTATAFPLPSASMIPITSEQTGPTGPRGTQVLGLRALPAPPIAPPEVIGEGPTTGPSMRSIQGASMSEPPPAPSSTGRVVGTGVVLALVAILGVVVGVVASRGTVVAAPVAPPLPPVVSAVPTPPAVPVATPTPTVAIAAPTAKVVDFDAGVTIAVGNLPSSSAKPKPSKPTTKGRERTGGGKSEPGDDYGF